MSAPSPSGQQTLSLTGLRFNANLGILPHERAHSQPIQVDAELNQAQQPCCPLTTTSAMCSTTAKCGKSSWMNAAPNMSICSKP